MATRLLLRSFRLRSLPPVRPSHPAAGSSSVGSNLRQNLAGSLLRRSPPDMQTAILPNIRWFGGSSRYSSSFKAAPPRRSIRSILSACFVSTSAAAALLDLEEMKPPPTRPHPASASGAASATTLLLDWDDGGEHKPPTRPHVERENRRMTDALIALHLLAHGADVLTNRKLIMWGIKNNDLIRKGQIWRLATSSVLHTGIIHIGLNMLFLDDIGPTMEEINGPRRFLAIYCASAIAGSIMSYKFTPTHSVGASDAICGLMGAKAVYTWRRRESLTSSTDTFKKIAELIILNLALSLPLKLIKIRIDDWAHLGGLVGGAAAQWFLGPRGNQHVARIRTMAFEERAPMLFD